ncbi:MAG: hypothetical protein HKN43_14475 [Rhodothermales bacterium]|nr:hypothetical protein [Rhodothermales bacterium]
MKAPLAIVLLATTFSLVACDSSNVVDSTVTNSTTSLETLQQELELTSKEVSDLQSILSTDEGVEMDKRASQSWEAAKYLQENLSDAQKTKLNSLSDVRNSNRREQRTRSDGSRDQNRRHRGRVELTDEQRELVATHRNTMKELIEEFKADGTVDESEREQIKQKQEAFRSELAETFSPEQEAAESKRQIRSPKKQSRRGSGAARFDRAMEYLDLSDDQVDKIDALRAELESTPDEFEGMDVRERRTALSARRKEMASQLDDILTVEQKELIEIHRSLTMSIRANRKADR